MLLVCFVISFQKYSRSSCISQDFFRLEMFRISGSYCTLPSYSFQSETVQVFSLLLSSQKLPSAMIIPQIPFFLALYIYAFMVQGDIPVSYTLSNYGKSYKEMRRSIFDHVSPRLMLHVYNVLLQRMAYIPTNVTRRNSNIVQVFLIVRYTLSLLL